MRKALFVLIFIAFSLPVLASDWAVRGDYANIRKGPSAKAMKVFVLKRTQYAAITDVGQKGGWLKVRFNAYISRKTFKYLRAKGVEMKRLGSEGAIVEVNISGWTKKDRLRKR